MENCTVTRLAMIFKLHLIFLKIMWLFGLERVVPPLIITFELALIVSLSNDFGDVKENGKKAIGLDWQNNNFARTFLCRRSTTTTWKCLISRFVENVNTRQQLYFSFPELRYSLLEFNSRKDCPHLTNWTRWKKRDKVWGSATSIFKWRFRSRRRRWCLSSLLDSLATAALIDRLETRSRSI